jgi:hypothetical protein
MSSSTQPDAREMKDVASATPELGTTSKDPSAGGAFILIDTTISDERSLDDALSLKVYARPARNCDLPTVMAKSNVAYSTEATLDNDNAFPIVRS